MRTFLIFLFGILTGLSLPAAATNDWTVSVGGDFRIRQEAFDHIPVKNDASAYTRGGGNDYFRFRSRLWMQLGKDDTAFLYGRLVNEFLTYLKPSNSKKSKFPDEGIVDNLYLRFPSLLDGRVAVTAGRQDLVLGSGRMMGDGTPKDGSRTSYLDALYLKAKLSQAVQLDVFGTYTTAENPLAIGNEHRDVTGYGTGFNDMDEAGAGAFLTTKHEQAGAASLYYLWKHDTAWRTASGEHRPNEDIHTVGVQLSPRLSSLLSADLEWAGQWSPSSVSDRQAMLAFGGLTLSPSIAWNPYASFNTLYLSGDDPETEKREDWNPLWGRYPWLSEVLLYTYDEDGVGLWNNMTYFWFELGCSPAEGHRLRGTLGYLTAPEADGTGGGHDRGWLAFSRYDFPLFKTANGEFSVFGHVTAQLFQPGNYYENDSKLAYFLRWELSCAF